MSDVPSGLSVGGAALWADITKMHVLDAAQEVQLVEVCRAKDRLDKLDRLLRGDIDTWARLTHRAQTEDYELKIDSALQQANVTANVMKQLLAAMRLPDAKTGARPQFRGARGAQQPAGKVSSLDRARARSAG